MSTFKCWLVYKFCSIIPFLEITGRQRCTQMFIFLYKSNIMIDPPLGSGSPRSQPPTPRADTPSLAQSAHLPTPWALSGPHPFPKQDCLPSPTPVPAPLPLATRQPSALGKNHQVCLPGNGRLACQAKGGAELARGCLDPRRPACLLGPQPLQALQQPAPGEHRGQACGHALPPSLILRLVLTPAWPAKG